MAASSSKIFVIVLGMHRSGTSAVTRGLKELGIDLGSNLMPGIPGNNDKGFWEDIDFNNLNIELLKAIRQDWHTLSLMDVDDLANFDLSEYKIKAVTLIRDKIKNTRLFGLKDPRLSRLLPFWKEIFHHLGIETRFVIMIRNPLSVADSLKKRDGFPCEKTYYLWLEHIVSSITHTVTSRTVFVDYDNLVTDPLTQLMRIAHKLDLPEPDYLSLDFQEYAGNFIDKSLQHTLYSPADLTLNSSIPEAVKDSFHLLNQAANDLIDWDSKDFFYFFDKLHRELVSYKPIFRYADLLENEISGLTKTCREQAGHINNLNEDIQQKTISIQSLSGFLDQKDQALGRARQQLVQKDQELDRMNNLLKQTEQDFQASLSFLHEEKEQLKNELLRCKNRFPRKVIGLLRYAFGFNKK